MIPVPLIVLGALVGGIWAPQTPGSPPVGLVGLDGLGSVIGATALLVLACELCFRGLVHGLLILDSRIQSFAGPWFLSRPVLVSGCLYGLLCFIGNQIWPLASAVAVEPPWSWFLSSAGAIITGLGLGLIRERSLSIWPGAALLFAISVVRIVASVLLS